MTSSVNVRYGGIGSHFTTVISCGVAIGFAPTSAVGIGADGALTLGTALSDTYSNPGIWLYLPALSIDGANAAGFYWTVMSSTTLGTVYNNVYTPGTTDPRDYPTTPTAFSGTTGAAFTGTSAEVTVFSTTIPGGTLGKHGQGVSYSTISTAGASAPIFRIKYGGSTVRAHTLTTSGAGSVENKVRMAQAGATNVQKTTQVTTSYGTLNTIPVTKTTVDSTVDQTALMSIQPSSTTVGTVLETFSWDVLSS